MYLFHSSNDTWSASIKHYTTYKYAYTQSWDFLTNMEGYEAWSQKDTDLIVPLQDELLQAADFCGLSRGSGQVDVDLRLTGSRIGLRRAGTTAAQNTFLSKESKWTCMSPFRS